MKMITHRNACNLSRYLRKSLIPMCQPLSFSTAISISLPHDDLICQTRTIHLHNQMLSSMPLTRSLSTTGNDASKPTTNSNALTDVQAFDMIHQLSDADRAALTKAINQYESNKIKTKFQGKHTIAFRRIHL